MSVSLMLSGRLTADPAKRKSKAGRDYLLATLRAANGAEWETWKCLVMTSAAQDEMLRQRCGDRVTLQGTPSIKLETEEGPPTIVRTLFVDAVIDLRPKARQRKSKVDGPKTAAPLLEMASSPQQGRAPLDDPLPF